MSQIKQKMKFEETDELSIDLIRATRQTIENKQCPATEDGSGAVCGYNFVFRFHGNRTEEAFISDKNMAAMGVNGAIKAAFHIVIDKALDAKPFTVVPSGVGKSGLLNFKIVEDPSA